MHVFSRANSAPHHSGALNPRGAAYGNRIINLRDGFMDREE